MELRFPLSDVKIEITSTKKEVESPLYDDGFYRLNQNEFSMDVAGVGWFYASGGNYISLFPYPNVNKSLLELYLNGSSYGAILHQRKIMPMHGSCFVFDGKGIMICGESGAGKSSITASFSLSDGEFLTDDVTPVSFTDGEPFILALSDRIKLWEDSLEQLKIEKTNLAKIDSDYSKFYLPKSSEKYDKFSLNLIFVLQVCDKQAIEFEKLDGVEKFVELRQQIYRDEYLIGMPETEAHYLSNLIDVSNRIMVIRVFRPVEIEIEILRTFLSEFIENIDAQ